MATPVTIKGGKVRVLLESPVSPGIYEAPCGFTQRSVTLNKQLADFQLPDCDDPDKVDWLGRDATSLSMTVSGEGVAAEESVEVWWDAFENVDSIGVKVEMEFPSKLATWTGRMHIESLEQAAPNGQRVTMNVTMQSDGEMVRVMTP